MAELPRSRLLARMRVITGVARELISDFDKQPLLGAAVQMPLAVAAGFSGGSGYIAGSTAIGVYLALKAGESRPKMSSGSALSLAHRRSLEVSSLVAAPVAPYVAAAMSNTASVVEVPAVLGVVGVAVLGRWRLITNHRDSQPNSGRGIP
ncbi:MAG: hypothetical protein HOQ05_09210 [Corynebacteriales bacterium]|nr:hypothetical protein [Mycobacteriales bacterium]